MMCFKKLRNFYTVKMSPTSVWYHPLLKSKKKKRKIAPPPLSEILDPPLMIDKYMYDV